MKDHKTRCSWAKDNPLLMEYHDHEWGVPLYDDQKLFEFLILEGVQAGLSWLTVLKKREDYRKLFDNFNPTKIANYDKKKVKELLQDPRIIRNRLKVAASITNANIFLEVKKEWGSFSEYIWQFTEGASIQNHWQTTKQIPASTPVSDLMSKMLKKRGFKFVGSTICYAFMQAVGMVNDHCHDCFRFKEVKKLSR
ncbi:MAG: DNA-3-methyladenine glycosylase I [Gammaproteobacteria bacterium]